MNPSTGTPQRPSLQDNLRKVQAGESPLDYIHRNLSVATSSEGHEQVQEVLAAETQKAQTSQGPVVEQPQPQPHTVEAPAREATVLTNTAPEPTPAPEPEKDPLDVDYAGEAPVIEAPEDGEDPEETKGLTLADNLKRLRASNKETVKKLKEVEEVKVKLEKDLEDYKKGNTIPEKIQEYEDKITELSYWQKLHNFKASDEYQEKYQTPLTEARNKLNEIAADYKIPQEVMDEALNYSTGSELNNFLSEHFDAVGALEVKELIKGMKGTQALALEAEKQPLEALTRLQEENQAAKQVQDQQRKQVIATRSKGAWTSALTKIQAGGKVPELVYSSSDSEHNDNVVKPILTAASVEYGKMVRMLAEAGLKDLSPELAEALANSVLWGHASAVSVTQREEAVRYAEDLHSTLNRTAKFDRPAIGAPRRSQSNGAAPTNELMTPAKAAEALLNQTLRR